MLGVREQRTIRGYVQLRQLPWVLPGQHRVRPVHVHRRLWRDRGGDVCPVWPSNALQQSVSFNTRNVNELANKYTDLDSRLTYPRPRPRLWCPRPRRDWKSMTGMDYDKQRDWKSHDKQKIQHTGRHHTMFNNSSIPQLPLIIAVYQTFANTVYTQHFKSTTFHRRLKR